MLPINVSAGSKSGTARVWAGVPLIGHVYVCTPYTVKYSGKGTKKNITSIQTKASYTSAGVALVAYSNYESWGKRISKKKFQIFARGHCDFVFKGCPVSMGLQTFRYTGSI